MLAAGSLIGAVLASSCCILPLLLALGVSGVWIGRLTAPVPYQPVFLLATGVFAAGLGSLLASQADLRARLLLPEPALRPDCQSQPT